MESLLIGHKYPQATWAVVADLYMLLNQNIQLSLANFWREINLRMRIILKGGSLGRLCVCESGFLESEAAAVGIRLASSTTQLKWFLWNKLKYEGWCKASVFYFGMSRGKHMLILLSGWYSIFCCVWCVLAMGWPDWAMTWEEGERRSWGGDGGLVVTLCRP